MTKSFFRWYYSQGLSGSFVVWFNFVRAVWLRGNVADLASTLFAPWHRDSAPRTWVGLHPVLSLERFTLNAVSRFVGMIVRLLTIGMVILVSLAVLLFGGILTLAYLLAPLLLVLSLVFFLSQSGWLFITLLLTCIGLGLAWYGYLFERGEILKDISFEALKQSPLFSPVLFRLGFEKSEHQRIKGETGESFLHLLEAKGLSESDYQTVVLVEKHFALKVRAKKEFWSWDQLSRQKRLGKSWKYGYTVHLDRYAQDLSEADYSAYKDDDLIGKEGALKSMLEVLERTSQHSVLLVGDAGIGKQSLVHYLARLIRENSLMGSMFDDMRLLWLDMARVVSDADASGSLAEDEIRRLFTEATLSGNCIVAIPHIERFLLPDSNGRHFRVLLEEFLSYPNFRMIGMTDTNGKLLLDKANVGALGLVEIIQVPEPNEHEVLIILLSEFHDRERREGRFTLKALQSIIKNAESLHWETPFPERAINLTEAILGWSAGQGMGVITESEVNKYLSEKTGIPRGEIQNDEKEKLLNLETLLHERLIGQDEAIRQIAEALRKSRAGFSDTKRPIGSFLFLGPTGVGKTEAAKALAHAYFGSEDKMIRLDMSEFQTDEAVDRLIGSSSKGMLGALTSAVTQSPYSILLLDELEKAYPKALDLFLQILDEGFVTDGYGQKINFRNCIIIATSNGGALFQKQLQDDGVAQAELERRVIEHLAETGVYRLEFLNRFDGVIFFLPLTESELTEVVHIKLSDLAYRLKSDKNITLNFGEGVAEVLVERGYDPTFGARSLNRFLSETIEDRIARAFISGELKEGGNITIGKDDI
jgi:ATP-dependent Clp protease ATP-binding subunit ClpC